MDQSDVRSIDQILTHAPSGLFSAPFPKSVFIQGVTGVAGSVKPGWAYVAIKGARVDGHEFISVALQNGASLIVGERTLQPTPYLQTSNSREALAFLASQLAGTPSFKLKVLGVTGTSGKTTTTALLESIYSHAGLMPGLLGTVEWKFVGKSIKASHTTPSAEELQKFMLEALRAGCKSLIMEVSSHALDQARVAYTAFDCVGFTNLSHEHLDYHPSFESYFEAKKKLFTEVLEYSQKHGKSPRALIREDSEWGKQMALQTDSRFRARVPKATEVVIDLNGISGTLDGVKFKSPMVGDFNLENIELAWGMAASQGIRNSVIAEGIAKLKGVPGRLERVIGNKPLHVWVDYAHKPDALERVLRVLNRLKNPDQKLHLVFGCGGDRDRSKRPIMGRIASEMSDVAWITSDNPRTEDPQLIVESILSAIPQGARATIHSQTDRAKAISQAIQKASVGDLVLIAGKGHETHQLIGAHAWPFDDRIEVKKALDSTS